MFQFDPKLRLDPQQSRFVRALDRVAHSAPLTDEEGAEIIEALIESGVTRSEVTMATALLERIALIEGAPRLSAAQAKERVQVILRRAKGKRRGDSTPL